MYGKTKQLINRSILNIKLSEISKSEIKFYLIGDEKTVPWIWGLICTTS